MHFYKNKEKEFKGLIDDISEKVQNSKIIITSKNSINIQNQIDLREISLGELSSKSMYKLIIPPKKSEEEVRNEFHELCIKTNHLDELGNLQPFYDHELFQRLGGNPLCGLLVSSNADSKCFTIKV